MITVEEQLVSDLTHFISKDGMFIEGIGTRTIKELVANKTLTQVVDLYDLTLNDLTKLGYPREQAKIVITSITKTLRCTLRRLIRGLNIEHMTGHIARELDFNFGYGWHNVDRAFLKKIPDITSEQIIGILSFINRKDTYGLKDLMELIKPTTEFNPYATKGRDAINVAMCNITASELSKIKTYMRVYNMRYVRHIDKTVKYLVIGSEERDVAAKIKLAKRYKVRIMNYKDFLDTFKKISAGI